MGRREYGGGGGMPGWLGALVEESFFVGCGSHEKRRKNEKNIFCLGCCTSICPHCVPAHPSHPLLQLGNQEKIMHVGKEFAYPGFLLVSDFGIANLFHWSGDDYCHLDQVRRYVYNDVVRLDDLEKLIDCSFVQPYTINSAKVVFLKPRPQSRPSKVSGNTCLTCDRILQEPFRFCSLSCKVDHVLLQGEDLSSILFRFEESELAFSHFENLRMDNSDPLDDDDDDDDDDDGQITGSAVLERPMQSKVGSPSGHGGKGSSGTKKNKSNAGFFPQIVLSLNNRRKGAPHRSPLS